MQYCTGRGVMPPAGTHAGQKYSWPCGCLDMFTAAGYWVSWSVCPLPRELNKPTEPEYLKTRAPEEDWGW